MKRYVFVCGLAGSIAFIAACVSHPPAASRPSASTEAISTNAPSETVVTNPPTATASAPVYVPDTTHENDPLPDGIMAWNGPMQSTNVPASTEKVHFMVDFTNLTSDNIAIMDVHPSCGCTTAELPARPWIIGAQASGEFPVTIDLTGKNGTLFKSVKIATDKGTKEVYFRIVMEPAPPVVITEEDKERFVAMSKADRQAIFKGDCADCHVKKGEGKYGEALYYADCAICHEADPRPTMVPDLRNLKVPTNADFWKQWIAHGKAGSLMAAFSDTEGGPLNDLQIASLVAYLNTAIPSKVQSPQ